MSNRNEPKKFGDVLRKLLDVRGLSQKQLAEDLNISPGAIGNYVRNNREPDYRTLMSIAEYFGVTTDFLLDFHAEPDQDRRDRLLLQVFHRMTDEQKDLFIEQGKVFVRSNIKLEKESASAS